MGISGSGKTTIGGLLAREMEWPFYDGDDYHPPANVDKMREGISLTDEDRKPWLDALTKLIRDLSQTDAPAVIACSALKKDYRAQLRAAGAGLTFVHLAGSFELIHSRLRQRQGHYMNPVLLASQFETLEAPDKAVEIAVDGTPESIVSAIREQLHI